MYTPPAFREDRPEVLRAIMRAARLALLVSAAPDGGAPEATHLPLLLDEAEGPHGTLYGHLAKANPQWKGLAAAGVARAVFPGPEAYVSPSLYAAKREHGRVVPTWNYVAVHAIGPVEVFEDPARLHAVVARLTDRHESARAEPWAVTDAPAPFVAGQLKGIVGIALRIGTLIGKRKLSQNRAEADREGVIAGLAASDDPADRAVAGAMREG
ncbi:FMN-binding negative transcriptional regulator [Roseomonas alkaliterrae]|uniref:Transcriptional regulator n=1 Tax=Neoroseomonas alkaliterrae TaxID=1452450 RepID=A0A840Y260_9PROT|nr:FMN-binding negative transcriptional regulator [Neoroseomonas alkaliterrae]MBB5687964.1 transcriptional regulator [Neoroseomonas alkaliterrae]MBR0676907.1 FMN-binding negative transcriptional regulator [Neoroseomonas alkaliterrae]